MEYLHRFWYLIKTRNAGIYIYTFIYFCITGGIFSAYILEGEFRVHKIHTYVVLLCFVKFFSIREKIGILAEMYEYQFPHSCINEFIAFQNWPKKKN